MHSDEMLTVDDDSPPSVTSPATTNSDSRIPPVLPAPPVSPRQPARRKDGQIDGRSRTSANNAKLAGIPKGTQLPTKRTLAHVQERAIEAYASRVLETGKTSIRHDPQTLPITEDDRRSVARTMGMPVEDFQARMALKLEELAELAGQRMREKLEADLYKPGELNMALAITIDKHAALSGRNALKGASVQIQVNNFGDGNKEDLIREIRGALAVGNAIDVMPVVSG